MTSINTTGFRLDSTRADIVPPEADCDDMAALGLIDYGHFHRCPELMIRIAGTSMVEPARLNPMFGYWVGQDAAGLWVLASSLGGWNVIGSVERFDGGELADGVFYAVDHDEPADGPCSMVVRRALRDEIGTARTPGS